MKTDNSNIVVESLEDASLRYANKDTRAMTIKGANLIAFAAGANWQKEQYKDLVKSHGELLKMLEFAYSEINLLGKWVHRWNMNDEKQKEQYKLWLNEMVKMEQVLNKANNLNIQ